MTPLPSERVCRTLILGIHSKFIASNKNVHGVNIWNEQGTASGCKRFLSTINRFLLIGGFRGDRDWPLWGGP